MSKQAFHLAGKTYTVKKQVEDNVRHIAANAALDVPLRGKHFEFMRDLFAYHSRADLKIGPGIAEIVVRTALRNRNNREFWLRQDGATEFIDISWTECVRNTSPLTEFRNACRLAVKPDTQSFADAVFATEAVDGYLVCPLIGIRFARDHAHVDHDDPWPFTKLVQAFVAKEQIDLNAVKYDGFEHGSTFVTLKDPRLRERFREFHNNAAKLRVVSDKGNLKRG